MAPPENLEQKVAPPRLAGLVTATGTGKSFWLATVEPLTGWSNSTRKAPYEGGTGLVRVGSVADQT